MTYDAHDITAIGELRAMARLYEQRGLLSKAEELLSLVEEMELRISRTMPVVDSATVDITDQAGRNTSDRKN